MVVDERRAIFFRHDRLVESRPEAVVFGDPGTAPGVIITPLLRYVSFIAIQNRLDIRTESGYKWNVR